MKNCHMSPYLDDEFLEVARTSQDSLKKNHKSTLLLSDL
jgi:hypothetical protein